MPTATLNLWKRSFFTPFSPSSTKTLKIASMALLGTTKSNSPLAYLSASLRLSIPSLSASYLSKRALVRSSFFRASAFFTALSFNALELASMASVPRVHSLILCRSFASVCFVSEEGWPGTSWVLISGPFERMKSVHAFILSLASWPASSTAFAVARISSSLKSLSPESGSASSLSVLAAPSASVTSLSSSAKSCSARSWASLRFLSISSLCSSTLFCCSLISSMRCLACSSPWSASCLILDAWVAQLSSSFCNTSSSSLFSSSKFSGLAERTRWRTRRMLSAARCSSRFCAASCSRRALSSSWRFLSSSCCRLTSSIRFLCSSRRLWLASSSFFLLSSSCCRCSSCCCRCCCLLISSSFFRLSICCCFFISSCCFAAIWAIWLKCCWTPCWLCALCCGHACCCC
mmetsp:Transcript_113/g.352  ORF Transcript_113/g.352 Transcript_113/m.352 type:complete len:405 (-) Transcript_113:275-1489(-)